jgi:hypothetical protein
MILAPSYLIGASGSRGASVDCRVDRKRQAARTYLDGVAATLGRAGRNMETRVLVRARPAPAIVDFVASEGVGLLALSGSGRDKQNALVPELLGLLEDAPVATLTYCPPESRLIPRLRPWEA